jgi:hypothetical protein
VILVLDTNIIYEDFLMRSARFAIIRDFAARTESVFLMPRIVFDELRANYARELFSRSERLRGTFDSLNGLLIDRLPPVPPIDIQDVTEQYMKHVSDVLELGPGSIREYGESYLRDVVHRAINRRRPCTDKGEEIRDALLWQTILDVAADSRDLVVLISRNTKQFAPERASLHPDLQAEIADRGVRVEYYSSLEEFIRQHATPIAFITEEWLTSRLDEDEIFAKAYDAIEEAVDRHRWIASYRDAVAVGDWTMSGGVSLDEFFVYRMADESIRVQAQWYGHCEVEREIEAESEEPDYDWEVDIDPVTGDLERHRVRRSRRRLVTRSTTADFRVHISSDIVIRNGAVESWDVNEVRVEED